jgi:hypothetical protein
MSETGIKQIWIGADDHKRLKALAEKDEKSMRMLFKELLDEREKKGKR